MVISLNYIDHVKALFGSIKRIEMRDVPVPAPPPSATGYGNIIAHYDSANDAAGSTNEFFYDNSDWEYDDGIFYWAYDNGSAPYSDEYQMQVATGGIIGHCRVEVRNEADTASTYFHMSVTATGGGGDIELPTTSVNAGDALILTGQLFNFSVPIGVY